MSLDPRTLDAVGRLLADCTIELASGRNIDALASAQTAHALLGIAIRNSATARVFAAELSYEEALANGDILDELAARLDSDTEPFFSAERDLRPSDDGERGA